MRWQVWAEQRVQDGRGAGGVETAVRGREGRERGRDGVLKDGSGLFFVGEYTTCVVDLHASGCCSGQVGAVLERGNIPGGCRRQMLHVGMGSSRPTSSRHTGTLQHGKPIL